MKKTCKNCIYYSSTIIDPNEGHHMHDFCWMWGRPIPYNSADEPDENGYYPNDIEREVAMCWLFEEKS